MSRRGAEESRLAAELHPDELAAESATTLPDREAMSLITGPGGAGLFPMMGPSFGPFSDDVTTDPAPTEPIAPAPDTGPAT